MKVCLLNKVSLIDSFNAGFCENVKETMFSYLPNDAKITSCPGSRSNFRREWTRRPHSSMDSCGASWSEDSSTLQSRICGNLSQNDSKLQNSVSHERNRDVEPYLGPKLKKALMKHGLQKQKLSVHPDDWDDEEVKLMLGSVFSSPKVHASAYTKLCRERKSYFHFSGREERKKPSLVCKKYESKFRQEIAHA